MRSAYAARRRSTPAARSILAASNRPFGSLRRGRRHEHRRRSHSGRQRDGKSWLQLRGRDHGRHGHREHGQPGPKRFPADAEHPGGNTYTGNHDDRGRATLKGGATNAFSANSATTVEAGGTLDLDGFDQTSARSRAPAALPPAWQYVPSAAILTNQGASSTFSGVIQDGTSHTGLTAKHA